MNKRSGVRGAQRLLGVQLALVLFLTLMAGMFFGAAGAMSAGLGGLVCFLPTVYFAKSLFQHQGARAAKQIVRGFYKGEAVKLGLTAVLFALVFKCFNIIPIVFFVVYIMAQMVFWFAPLITK